MRSGSITKPLKLVFHDCVCLFDGPHICKIAVHEVEAVSFNDAIGPAWFKPCNNHRAVGDRVC